MSPSKSDCALVLLPDGTATMHNNPKVTVARALESHPGFALTPVVDPRYTDPRCHLPHNETLLLDGVYQLVPSKSGVALHQDSVLLRTECSPSATAVSGSQEAQELTKHTGQMWLPQTRGIRPLRLKLPGLPPMLKAPSMRNPQPRNCPVSHSLPAMKAQSVKELSAELDEFLSGFDAPPAFLHPLPSPSSSKSRNKRNKGAVTTRDYTPAVSLYGTQQSAFAQSSQHPASPASQHSPSSHSALSFAGTAHYGPLSSPASASSSHTETSSISASSLRSDRAQYPDDFMFVTGVVYDSCTVLEDEPTIVTRARTAPTLRRNGDATHFDPPL